MTEEELRRRRVTSRRRRHKLLRRMMTNSNLPETFSSKDSPNITTTSRTHSHTHDLFLQTTQEPHYRWPVKMHDYFFKLVDKEELQPTKIVWLRPNMDAKISIAAHCMLELIFKKQKVQVEKGAVTVTLARADVKDDNL